MFSHAPFQLSRYSCKLVSATLFLNIEHSNNRFLGAAILVYWAAERVLRVRSRSVPRDTRRTRTRQQSGDLLFVASVLNDEKV